MKPKLCEYCNQIFTSKKRNAKQRFCCKSCGAMGSQNNGRFTKDKPSWNKGLKDWRKDYHHSEETKNKIGKSNKKENPKSKVNELLRKSKQFKEWRSKVFERDKYKCQECGVNNHQLHPHHIKEFAKYPLLRFEVSNGITLCSGCHQKKHKIQFTGDKAVKL